MITKRTYLISFIYFILLILGNYGCSIISPAPAVKTQEPPVAKSKDKIPVEDITTPASPVTDVEKVPPTDSFGHKYQDIIDKISTNNFIGALENLNQFTQTCSYPKNYGLEAQIFRFCVLASLRSSYLNLGSVYHQGWQKIVSEEKALSKEEKLKQLTNLTQAYLFYYRRHKELTIALITTYDRLIHLYPDLLPADLRLIVGRTFTNLDVRSNPLLDEIKQGTWLEANARSEVEKIEFNNKFLAYFLSLLGVNSMHEANTLLKQESIILDKPGFLFWLSQSLKYQPVTLAEGEPDTALRNLRDAFADEPGLIKALEQKSVEGEQLLKQMLQQEWDKKSSVLKRRFDPLTRIKE